MKDRRVSLKINGEEIPLNEFVQEFISSTILGMIASLKKKRKDIKKIEIFIELENETES